MRLVSGVSSSVGLVRSANEDSYLVGNGIYVVCDGMGGARAGEVASEMACRGLMEVDPAAAEPDDLLRVVKETNRAIAAKSLEEEGLTGMGTTLTGAMVRDRDLTLVHVGDSRAYLLREGQIKQLTEDHSWVGELMRRGELTPEEAAIHPHRSIITRALGTDPDVDPDLVETEVEVGDRLLLCSDGLTGMMSDAEILQILGQDEQPPYIAAQLVDAALVAGGEDNVTVIVVDFADDSGGESTAEAEAPDGTTETEEPAGRVVGPADRGLLHGSVADKSTGSAKKGLLRRRWIRRRWVKGVLIAVLVLAIAVGGFAVVNLRVYYVGAVGGVVALYRGLPADICGIELSRMIERASVGYDSLSRTSSLELMPTIL